MWLWITPLIIFRKKLEDIWIKIALGLQGYTQYRDAICTWEKPRKLAKNCSQLQQTFFFFLCMADDFPPFHQIPIWMPIKWQTVHYIYKIHFRLELDLSEIVSLNLRRCLISKCKSSWRDYAAQRQMCQFNCHLVVLETGVNQ